MRILGRAIASGLLLIICSLAGTTSLAFIVAKLGAPYPVRISRKTEVASVGLDRVGQIAISVTPALAHSASADMLAFLYLHEMGHVRAGHLRPRDPNQVRYFMAWEIRDRVWKMEYEADDWAAKKALTVGHDPVSGIQQLFWLFGDGGGLTHPPDKVRIERVRAATARRATEVRR